MKTQPNSEDLARAICAKVVTELGRLVVDRNRDNRELRRILRYSGISREALNVPVYKLGDENENGNVDERIELDVNRGSRDGLQFPRRRRLPGQDWNL